MNREKITMKVNQALFNQKNYKSIIIPVDILIEIGVLRKSDYEKWRFGKIEYLERVCTCNLSQLSYIMEMIRKFARNHDLKPSKTVYMSWGKNKKLLRFSKSGNVRIENNYSTHYIVKH